MTHNILIPSHGSAFLPVVLQVAEETKESVDAVHEIVDETNRGVKNIEALLKSCKLETSSWRCENILNIPHNCDCRYVLFPRFPCCLG